MNRRAVLVSIGLTAFSEVAWSASDQIAVPQSKLSNDNVPSSEPILDSRLREDLARLAPRAYSEEGIPVFLVCENLVPAKTSQPTAKVTLTALNTALASAFHRNAEAFQRIHPDAKAKDVAPLIEVLADRDFANGGTTEKK